MKRIQINANAVFANAFKESNGVSFFEVLLKALADMFKGIDVKIVEEEDYNCIYEINDESNPFPCAELQKYIVNQFDLKPEQAVVSVYNYKPAFTFSKGF